MVWYVPPLSPVMSLVEGPGSGADPDDVFPAIDELRIPIEYLARHAHGGRPRAGTRRAAAPRRDAQLDARANLGGEPDPALAAAVGMEPGAIDAMFRLLAIAKYDERYVIPQTHGEIGINPHSRQGACGLDFEGGPGSCGAIGQTKDPFGAEPLAAPQPPAAARTSRSSTSGAAREREALSVLLLYPDETLLDALPELREAAAALPSAERRALEPVLDGLGGTARRAASCPTSRRSISTGAAGST